MKRDCIIRARVSLKRKYDVYSRDAQLGYMSAFSASVYIHDRCHDENINEATLATYTRETSFRFPNLLCHRQRICYIHIRPSEIPPRPNASVTEKRREPTRAKFVRNPLSSARAAIKAYPQRAEICAGDMTIFAYTDARIRFHGSV